MAPRWAQSTATASISICGWSGRPGPGSPQPLPSCYCIRPDLTSKTFLLFPFSLSSSSILFFLLPFSFLCPFTSIPTHSPSLLFSYLHFSLPAFFLLHKARHYYQIIKRPMDLSIIRRKLQKKDPAHYTTPEEVVSDVRLMFWNCAKFNYVCLCMSCLFNLSPISQWPQDCYVGWVSGLVLGCLEDL